MKVIFLLSILIFLFSSCKETESHWKSDDMKRAISITSFKNPNTTCEVLRVDDSYPGEGKTKDGHSLHGYKIISAAEALNSALRKELSSIIENHDTYLRNAIPMDCLFRPGVAFRFIDQQNQVDLLVCFSCNELRYYLDGKVVDQSYFKSQELRSLVQGLFPKDEKIKSFKQFAFFESREGFNYKSNLTPSPLGLFLRFKNQNPVDGFYYF